jgi:hypothetical protein
VNPTAQDAGRPPDPRALVRLRPAMGHICDLGTAGAIASIYGDGQRTDRGVPQEMQVILRQEW